MVERVLRRGGEQVVISGILGAEIALGGHMEPYRLGDCRAEAGRDPAAATAIVGVCLNRMSMAATA